MEAPVSPPPAKRTRNFVSPRGKQSGGLAWLVVFEIPYYVIVINHFLADTRNIRGSATMIRLRISLQIYIYIYIYIHHVHVYTKTNTEGRNSKYQLKNIIIYIKGGGAPHTPTHTFLFIYSSTWQGLEWRSPE